MDQLDPDADRPGAIDRLQRFRRVGSGGKERWLLIERGLFGLGQSEASGEQDHQDPGCQFGGVIALGHKRIVLLVRESQRAGGAGSSDRAIPEEMAAHGLPTGPFNLPDWKDTPEGLQHVLIELFRITPPTALIIDEPFLFHAAKEHLAQRGMLAPAQVSLICTDPDPTFAWCQPSVAHIRWDHRPVMRRVVRWANNVDCGKDDRRQTLTTAEFIDGGTVGPVAGR